MLTVIITALMALTVAHAAFGKGRAAANWAIIKRYRPVHFITSIPVLGLVIVVATTLHTYVPYADKNPILWGLSTLFGWGDGTGQGKTSCSPVSSGNGTRSFSCQCFSLLFQAWQGMKSWISGAGRETGPTGAFGASSLGSCISSC